MTEWTNTATIWESDTLATDGFKVNIRMHRDPITPAFSDRKTCQRLISDIENKRQVLRKAIKELDVAESVVIQYLVRTPKNPSGAVLPRDHVGAQIAAKKRKGKR